MGLIISILTYVTKIFSNLIALKQKATNPQYNADTDSNEAISEAVAGVQSSVSSLSSTVNTIRDNTFMLERSSYSGSRTLDTYTHTIYTGGDDEPFVFAGGMIDLSNFQAGDKVRVMLSAKIHSADSFHIIREVTLSGPLTPNSRLEFDSMYNMYGVEVSIRQTAGTYRSIQYEWFNAKQLA